MRRHQHRKLGPHGLVRYRRTVRRPHPSRRALRYRSPGRAAVVPVGLVAALAVAVMVAGYVLAGAATIGVLLLAWLGLALRVRRLQPAGPRGEGPIPPGGVGVREPRRPLPFAPAGAAAIPLPEESATP